MSLVDLGYYENNKDDLSEISKHLEELPLYTFYDKIDKELGNNVATHNCEECVTRLSIDNSDESELLELCKRFCNIISKRSDLILLSDDPSRKISCLYMKLWLYSKVINITEESTIIDKFYKALQNISANSRSDMKFCDIEKFESKRDQFKNFKYLYEFLFTYDVINENISQERNRRDQLYCNHIKENFRFYNKIKEYCPPLTECPYKLELQMFEQIFSGRTKLSDIYSKCNYEQTTCKPNSIKINDIPCLKLKDSNFLSPKIDPDPDKVVNKIINGLTYSIPTLATLTMLYKFTPLGSWLYSKIKRTNNMENNINAENYYISHHNTRIEEIDAGNSSNNTY